EGVVRAGVALARGQFLGDPEPARPEDLAAVAVDREQPAPRRADARQVDRTPVGGLEARAERRIGARADEAAAVVELGRILRAPAVVALRVAPLAPPDRAPL